MPQPPASFRPHSTREDALWVLNQLRSAGFAAYFAGGCVRDALLGLEPKDYDIATDAAPAQVGKLFRRTLAVGAAFGVMLVRRGDSQVEVATFRRDCRYLDGRHPESVEFATAQEDARRRDFTINGLFYDPLADRVLDFVGGQADLANKTLRAIGAADQRFAEDHLRVLRAVRFAARFELKIEPHTAAAMVRQGPNLARISPERISEELRLMLCPPTRSAAWPLLWDYQLVEVIFRFLQPPEPQSGRAFDPARSIFLAVQPPETIGFALALAAGVLCYQAQSLPPGTTVKPLLGEPADRRAVRALRQALKISNQTADQVDFILSSAGELLAEAPPSLAQLKRFYARGESAEAILLLEALARLGIEPGRVSWLNDQFAALAGVDCAPPPLLTGDDLLAAGLAAGPLFKRLLHEVYDAQLENRIHSRAEALQLALSLANPPK